MLTDNAMVGSHAGCTKLPWCWAMQGVQNTIFQSHNTVESNQSARELHAQLHIGVAQAWVEQIVAHRREVHQSANEDEAVPDGVCKRYHSVGLEEHNTRDVDGATDGHLMNTCVLTLTTTHTHTELQVFIRLWGSRTLHLATKLNLATSYNLATPFLCIILPHNYTNIRIHTHTTPIHTSPTLSCMIMIEQGFSWYFGSTSSATSTLICTDLVAT